MSDDVITIKRSELRGILTVFAQEITRELGIKTKPIDQEWITKHQASKICPKQFGRRRIETAINKGFIRKKPRANYDNPRAHILLFRKDVEAQIKNPTL